MEKTQYISKEEAKAYLEELETFMSTLPYDGEMALEKADKREKMMSSLMRKKAHQYYVTETETETHPDKVEELEAGLAESIQEMERQLTIFKETTSAKEAYFNILTDKVLKRNNQYVRYAGTYVYDVIKRIYAEEDFKHITVRPSRDSTNTLPVAIMEFINPLDWGVKDDVNDYPKCHWFLFVGNDYHIQLSTLTARDTAARDFERLREQIEESKRHIDEAEAARVKYRKRVFFSPKLKSRIDNNTEQFKERQKQHIVQQYTQLTNDYDKMLDMSSDEMKQAHSEALSEAKRLISLLTERLGLSITTDLD